MLLEGVFEQFIAECPAAVMVRGTLEYLLQPEKIDAIFEETAGRQYTRDLLFSTTVDLMSLVTCRIQPSVNAAYRKLAEQVGVSITAVYDKLNRMEPEIGAALVRRTAAEAAQVIDAMPKATQTLLPGYNVRILDGNHLTSTEHRIHELRLTGEGPLPGQSLVVLDPQRMLVSDVLPCEDAHAQERSFLGQMLFAVLAGELWVADRNFCTTNFLFGIAGRKAFFLVRQHRSTLKWQLVGKRRRRGRVEGGIVYEQAVELRCGEEILRARRITIVLDEPTRDGDTEINLLTNVPARDASPRTLANLYRKRWTIEGAFQSLSEILRCEVTTLGYPKAALFAFCVALLAYNTIAVTKAALRSVHGAEVVEEKLSDYHLTTDVASVHQGMMIALPAPQWQPFRAATPKQLARTLVRLAAKIDLVAYRKNVRGPKKPRPKRRSGKRNHHISTARILAARKTA